jgi:hypothetical protein
MWRGEGAGEGEDDKNKNEEKKRLEQMSAQLSAKEFERFCFYVMSIMVAYDAAASRTMLSTTRGAHP